MRPDPFNQASKRSLQATSAGSARLVSHLPALLTSTLAMRAVPPGNHYQIRPALVSLNTI